MKDFNYHMPTRLMYGEDVVLKNAKVFSDYGKKAIVITGKSSSKKNGSLNDVIMALKSEEIPYVIFDEIEENPSLQSVEKAAKCAKEEGVEFVIGIGGGSPMDAAKAVAFLALHFEKGVDFLFEKGDAEHLPILLIPTTAGTGSEVTQYAILTSNERKTKVGIAKRTFADVAFLDLKYFENMPLSIVRNTAVDALTHAIEAYLCNEHNYFSDLYCIAAFTEFQSCKEALLKGELDRNIREKLLLISTMGGMAIAQSQTSLPHAMGYYLTYFKGVAHGVANAQFEKAYMDFIPEQERVQTVLHSLGFKDSQEFEDYLFLIVEDIRCSEEEIEEYTKAMMLNHTKLITVNRTIETEDMYQLFLKSLS